MEDMTEVVAPSAYNGILDCDITNQRESLPLTGCSVKKSCVIAIKPGMGSA